MTSLLRVLVLLAVLVPSWVDAATYYIDPGGDNTRSCSAAQLSTTPRKSLGGIFGRDGASTNCVTTTGNTIVALGGVYVRVEDKLWETTYTVPANTTVEGMGMGVTIFRPPAGNEWRVDQNNGLTLKDFTIDLSSHTGSSGSSALYIGDCGGACALSTNITLTRMELMNGRAHGLFGRINGLKVDHSWIHHNGLGVTGDTSGLHGVYMSTGSKNMVFEYNKISNNGAGSVPSPCDGGGLHIFPGSGSNSTGNVFRYNDLRDNKAFGIAFTSGVQAAQVYRNLFLSNGCTHFSVLSGSSSGSLVYNNTFVGTNRGVQFGSTSTTSGHIIRNNIFNGTTAVEQLNGGSNTVDRNICVTATPDCNFTGATNTTETSTPGFVGGGDYSLASGATAINLGTTPLVGYSCNGACDLGAFETFNSPTPSAVIDLNIMDIQLGMSTNGPVLPAAGMTGFSVACTGTNCGTPVIQTAARKIGSDSIIRLTLTGIGGGSNACNAAQTWTWSYTPGNVTDSSLVGNSLNQPLFAASTQPVTETCSGSVTPPPSGPSITYEFEDGTSGTTPTTVVDGATGVDGTQNGTLTNGPTWTTTGHVGNGVVMADNSDDYVAIPYGSAVNPSTQPLTIAFTVLIPSGIDTLSRSYFGSTGVGSTRFYISTSTSTWRIGIQNSSDSASSNLAVTPGTHRVCLVMSGSQATLTVDGVAGTGGASKAYTSYTFASDFRLGSPFSETAGVTYDQFKLWRSAENCATDFASWQQVSPPPTGTLTIAGCRFMNPRRTSSGGTEWLRAFNTELVVRQEGYFAIDCQIDSTVADPVAFGVRMQYDNADSTFLTIPDTFTADGLKFYGNASDASLVNDVTGSYVLTGALATVPGATQLTSAAVPIVDPAINNSVVLRYILAVAPTATVGSRHCLKPSNQNGNAFNGGMTPSGGLCFTVSSPAAHTGSGG